MIATGTNEIKEDLSRNTNERIENLIQFNGSECRYLIVSMAMSKK